MEKQMQFDLRDTLHEKRLIALWRLLRGYYAAYIGATLALALSALAKTATYLLLRRFADLIAGEAAFTAGLTARQTYSLIALGFLGLALLEGGFAFLSGRLAAYTAEGIARRVRNYLLDHIQRLSFAYHSQTSTGDLIERVTSDVDALRRFFADQAIGAGRIILLFGINFAAIYHLNARLAWVTIIVIPFILGVSIWFFKKVSGKYEAYQKQEAVLSTVLQENLSGVRVVKAFARQEYEKERFEKENWRKYLRGKELLRMHSLFWPISDIVLGMQMLGGFVYAAIMAIRGDITVGTYLAYVGLAAWLIWPIRSLGRMIVQASTGLVSYGRLAEIMQVEKEPIEAGDFVPSAPLRGDLDFQHVFFTYEDDTVPALQDITFTCHAGQSVALLGTTGSGKTTLVNLIPRFYDYTAGRILLDGEELTRYPRAWLRQQIGIVEQEPFLFSRSIRENITFGVGRNVSQEEVEAAARAAAIHDVILSFPEGYETQVGERGVTLSGGQKQRIAIARALLKDPRILILDDSTSSVDTETEAAIRAALRHLMQGRTTFIIAHRVQSVMNADLILVLEKGRIVQRGTHETLLAQDGHYREIYELQTRIDTELQAELEKGNTHA